MSLSVCLSVCLSVSRAGGPDNTEEDLLIVSKKLSADVHNPETYYRGFYVALANLNVQQK